MVYVELIAPDSPWSEALHPLKHEQQQHTTTHQHQNQLVPKHLLFIAITDPLEWQSSDHVEKQKTIQEYKELHVFQFPEVWPPNINSEC